MVIMKRRLGKFTLTRDLLDNHWWELSPIFALVVPVEVRFDYVADTIEYTAFSEQFEEVEAGYVCPFYTFQLLPDGTASASKD